MFVDGSFYFFLKKGKVTMYILLASAIDSFTSQRGQTEPRKLIVDILISKLIVMGPLARGTGRSALLCNFWWRLSSCIYNPKMLPCKLAKLPYFSTNLCRYIEPPKMSAMPVFWLSQPGQAASTTHASVLPEVFGSYHMKLTDWPRWGPLVPRQFYYFSNRNTPN